MLLLLTTMKMMMMIMIMIMVMIMVIIIIIVVVVIIVIIVVIFFYYFIIIISIKVIFICTSRYLDLPLQTYLDDPSNSTVINHCRKKLTNLRLATSALDLSLILVSPSICSFLA